MTDEGNAEVLEVVRCQTGWQIGGDGILAGCRLILAKPQRTQPVWTFIVLPRGWSNYQTNVA